MPEINVNGTAFEVDEDGFIKSREALEEGKKEQVDVELKSI